MNDYERIPEDYGGGLPEGELHEERSDEVWYHLSDEYLRVDDGSQLAGVGVKKWCLPLFEKHLNWKKAEFGSSRMFFDERMDALATILASYPTADTKKLSKEFGLSIAHIGIIAHYYGVHKTEERRREVRIENGREAFLRLLWAERKKQKPKRHGNQNQQKHQRRNDGDGSDAK